MGHMWTAQTWRQGHGQIMVAYAREIVLLSGEVGRRRTGKVTGGGSALVGSRTLPPAVW